MAKKKVQELNPVEAKGNAKSALPEVTLTITNKTITPDGPISYSGITAMLMSGFAGAVSCIKAQIPEDDDHRDNIIAEMYDIANRAMGEALDVSFPEMLKPADLDEQILLEAENEVMARMAKEKTTDKIIPLSVKEKLEK